MHTKNNQATTRLTSYNVMINGINFFNQPVDKNERPYERKNRAYDNSHKIANDQVL